MTHKKNYFTKAFVLLLLTFFCFSSSNLRATSAKTANSSTPENPATPAQDSVDFLTGKLNSGLTYYIKSNNDGSNRVLYNLIIKSGSLKEDESQRGLAHFNEHISFEGTENFKEGLIDGSFIKNLDKKRFYINAVTGQTETIYSLYLQDDRKTLADTALTLFRDWVYQDNFSVESIKKQSGIIAKEWLDFQNLSEEIRQQWFPTFYNNTKWAFRAPIGLIDVINKADVNEILRYRNEWYKPNISAITVVGNVNPQQILATLERLFSEPATNKIDKEEEEIVIPNRDKRDYLVITNPEQTMSFISLYNRVENPNLTTIEGIKSSIMYGMINTMLVERLSDARNKNNDVVSSLGAAMFNFIKPDWVYSPNAIFTNGKLKEAISLLVREQERIAQHGFLASEFNEAINMVKGKYRYDLSNGTSQSSAAWAKEFETHFLTNAPYMLPSQRAQLYFPIIESITLEDMNNLHSKIWSEKNSTAVIVVPQSDYEAAPKGEELAKLVESVKSEKLEPYKAMELTKPLFGDTKFENSGKIISNKQLTTLPVFKIKLSNGAEVVYYKDSTKSGSIVMEALSKGGKSVMKNGSDKYTELACKLVNEGPVGEYSLFAFQRLFSGSSMTISIANESESIKGNASPETFETLLQRVYVLFNNFEMSEDKYLDKFNSAKNGYLSTSADPNRELNNLINSKLYELKGSKNVESNSLELMESIISERFASLSDFTFYFTGALDEVEFEELITKYLSGGEKRKREEASDKFAVKLRGNHSVVFNEGAGSKAVVKYIVGAPCELNMNSMSLLQAANSLIEKRLFNKVREELHLVYNITSKLNLRTAPLMRADFEILFNCESSDVKKICEVIDGVFADFVKNGVEQSELMQTAAMMAMSKAHFANNDSFRLGCIRSHDQFLDNDYTMQLNNIEFIKAMSSESLQNIIDKLFNGKKALKASFTLESSK